MKLVVTNTMPECAGHTGAAIKGNVGCCSCWPTKETSRIHVSAAHGGQKIVTKEGQQQQ